MNNDWKHVKKVLKELEQLTEEHRKICNSVNLSPDSPLIKPILDLEELLVQTLEVLVGDKNDTISWYVYDNDYGKAHLKGGIDGVYKEIKSVKDLKWLTSGTE